MAIGPALSKVLLSVKSPSALIRPTVGLMAYKAARQPGATIDPVVSVPIDSGAKPAATPVAGPDDDPAGVYESVRINRV